MPNSPAMTVLPQFQGDAYHLQNQQALAQALMQQAFQPQNTQAVGSGQYSIVPKYSAVGGLAQLGQALLAAKMQNNVAEGYKTLGQNQWAALTGQPAQQTAAAPQQTTDAGGMTDNQSGAGVQSSPVPTPGQPTPQAYASALGGGGGASPQQGGLLSPGGPLNPNGIPTTAAAMMYMTPEGQKALFNSTASAYAPTTATMQARQGGFDAGAANRAQFQKDSYVAPTTGTGIMRNPFTQQPVAYNPEMPAGTTPLFDASGNVASVNPIQGAQGAMQGNSAAAAAGAAQFKPEMVYNPQTKQMEFSNAAAVTNPPQGGATPTLSGIFAQQESNGGKTAPDNPMQIQQGTFKQFAQPNESWSNPADRTAVANRVLNTYQQKYGGDLGRIATAYFSGEGNVSPAGSPTPFIKNVSDANGKSVASYVGDIYSRGTGMQANGGAPPSGRPAAAPPLGVQATSEATAKGQVDTMQKSYQNLQTVRSGAPAALQDVDNMTKLAQGASPVTVGPAGAKFAGLFSNNAAEYEKSRDNLVTNLGSQLGINSDAARDLVYGSIPSYGSPKQAVQNGLGTLRGQIQTRLLKSDYLSDAYANGDAKTYNQKENQFDQNVTPAIANQLATFNNMPQGPAKAAALKAAAGNPQLRPRLEWAVQNGILK